MATKKPIKLVASKDVDFNIVCFRKYISPMKISAKDAKLYWELGKKYVAQLKLDGRDDLVFYKALSLCYMRQAMKTMKDDTLEHDRVMDLFKCADQACYENILMLF